MEPFDCSTLQEAILLAPIIDIYSFLVETSVRSQRIRLAMFSVPVCSVDSFQMCGQEMFRFAYLVMFHLFHRSTVATFVDKWRLC